MNARSQVDLTDVFTTVELDERPSRPPDYKREIHALTGLMVAMAAQLGTNGHGDEEGSTSILQKLAETALELCGAHSVGVSTVEHANESEIFRWRAAAGHWAAHRSEVISCDHSSATVVDLNAAQLATYAERHYRHAHNIALPIAEAMLIAFYLGREPVGVIWVILHDETRRFDAEDRRLLMNLASFAGTAYHLLNQQRLASELAATQRLQELSTQLLNETRLSSSTIESSMLPS